MSERTSSRTYEQLIPDLHNAIQWFDDLGIAIDATRLGKYRLLLDEVLELQQSLDYEQAAAKFPDYLTTLYSAHEIALVYRGFTGRGYDSLIRDRLRQVASGPQSFVDEDTSTGNAARNAAFELIVGSYLSAAGCQLVDGTVADLVAMVGSRPVVFECKRPQTANGFERNLFKAHSQLKARYGTAGLSHSRGMIAIDISKIANDQFELLRVPGQQDVVQATTSFINKFVDQHSRRISQLSHPKTLAVILRLSVMAEIGHTEKNLVYHRHFGFVGLSQSTLRNRAMLESVRSIFERHDF